MTKPKLGLALGGGGGRGYAHIGVLKVLEGEGIAVDYLAGTSMGGLIAAAYAAGQSPAALEQLALRLSKTSELIKLVDLYAPRRGLMQVSRVRALLAELISEQIAFADLRIPLEVCAVDLVKGNEVVLKEGNLFEAVMATIAMPGLFPPQLMGDYQLVDGGVLNNVPADIVRRMGAEVILAIDPQTNPTLDPPWQDLPEKTHWPVAIPEFFLDFYRAELLMVAVLTRRHLDEANPELILRPAIPPAINMFSGFQRPAEVIAAGEQAALQALPRLKELLSGKDN